MKISWGYKIIIAYLLFVAGILFLAFKANQEKFDLVTKDYYDEELKYQQVIDQAANAAKLSEPVKLEKSGSSLNIIFPAEMNNKKKEIDFYLYYAADAKKDFKLSFETSGDKYSQPLPEGIAGQYELKLSWTAENVKYYHEQKIFF